MGMQMHTLLTQFCPLLRCIFSPQLFRFFITAPPEKMPKSHTMTVKILILLNFPASTKFGNGHEDSLNLLCCK